MRAPTEHRQQTYCTSHTDTTTALQMYFLKSCGKGGEVLDENAEQAGEQFVLSPN